MCEYRVVTTEFWRSGYYIEAENPEAALLKFDCLKVTNALPEPQRLLMGVIDPPEFVLDSAGKTVINNVPPADDAERMLFLEMWIRMREQSLGSDALDVSLQFICKAKRWDPAEMMKEVRKPR